MRFMLILTMIGLVTSHIVSLPHGFISFLETLLFFGRVRNKILSQTLEVELYFVMTSIATKLI